jgi:ankyrin repeat protein
MEVKKANEDMFEAVRHGQAGGLRAALEAGADVDAKDGNGDTALILAANDGDAECVGVLLAAGADVDAKDE